MAPDLFDQLFWSKIETGTIIRLRHEFGQEGQKFRPFLVIKQDEDRAMLLTCSMTSQTSKLYGAEGVYILKGDENELLSEETAIRGDNLIEMTKSDLRRKGDLLKIGGKIEAKVLVEILKSLEASPKVTRGHKKKVVQPLLLKFRL